MTVTRRSSIVEALRVALETIDPSAGFNIEMGTGNVYPRMIFWDEVNEFPTICLASGNESIEYQGGGFKDRYLEVILRCYVKDENSLVTLELLLEDIENIIDNNGRLAYQDSSGGNGTTRDILIINIDTDQGALAPLGVGEILLQVKY